METTEHNKNNKPSKTISQICIGDVTDHNHATVRCINESIFPVIYADSFYKDLAKSGQLAKLFLFRDLPVGAVACRLEPIGTPATADRLHPRRMYIMTLGVLAAYRRLGIGTRMIDYVLKLCDKTPSVTTVALHVQITNEAALTFYKRHGFEIVSTEEDYYRRLDPSTAYVLEKKIRDAEDIAGEWSKRNGKNK